MKKLRINRFMKSVLAIIVIVFLVLTSVMYSFGEQKFKDIEKHWGKQYIESMVSKSILTGYEDSTFKPDAPVSRVEAVVMVTRLFNKQDIEDTYNNSKSKYEADLKKYNVPTWSYSQMVYALEKGIINRSLISEFVKNGKQQNASRAEIAICLAKGLDLESELSSNPMITFNDVNKIDKNVLPYVDILIKKGIIDGKGDYKGNFNPSNSVTRAEMSKMLSVGNELLNKSIVVVQPIPTTPTTTTDVLISTEGKIYDVTTYGDTTTITILNSKDEKLVFSNKTNSISVKLEEELSNISSIKKDLEAILTVSGSKVYSIKIKNTEIEKEGYYYSNAFDVNKGGQYLSFKVNDKYEEYAVQSSTKFIIDGKDSSIYGLKKDDKVTFKIVNGKLYQVESISKSSEISGIVKSISSSEISITKDKKTYKYEIDDDAKIRRNDKTAKISDIKIGDNVNVSLEYGDAIKIEAKTVKTTVKGTIKELRVSSSKTPEITIELDDGDTETYKLLNGFTVEIDDDSAGFYDLKVNYTVKLTLESGEVSKIESDESSIVDTYTGEVIDTDTSGNTVEIETKDGKKMYIQYTSSTLIQDSNGKTRKESDIDEGDNISVIGEDKLGSIDATLIIIIK